MGAKIPRSDCRSCDRPAEGEILENSCSKCGAVTVEPEVGYYCPECDRGWSVRITVDKPATEVDRKWYCHSCSQSPSVWCPVCNQKVGGSFYLFITFEGQQHAYHAACLVTHYRHDHIKSHDLAWSNPHYAAKIPGYEYDSNKEKTNNRAKRQILRKLAKRRKDATIPDEIDAVSLVHGFEKLMHNDEKTVECIGVTLEILTN